MKTLSRFTTALHLFAARWLPLAAALLMLGVTVSLPAHAKAYLVVDSALGQVNVLPAPTAPTIASPNPVTAPTTPRVPLPPLPADPTDLAAMAQVLYAAVLNKQWALLVSLVILAAVSALRKWVPENTTVGVFLRTKLGGILSNLLLTSAGACAAALVAGATLNADLAFSILSISLSAAGGWAIFKNLREAVGEMKAEKAGTKTAESAPATVDTLNK